MRDMISTMIEGYVKELLVALAAFQKKGELENITPKDLYTVLEEMVYKYDIPIDSLLNYMKEQTESVNRIDVLLRWHDYLCLSQKYNGWERMPKSFIYDYNVLLEFAGKKPLIYQAERMFGGEYFYRNGDSIEFEGVFPCDDEGNPVMNWIGIKVMNAESISLVGERNRKGRLIVKLRPDTLILVRHSSDDPEKAEGSWHQAYAGPWLMHFNHGVLKAERRRLRYSQAEVAKAVKISTRTYQKWESGETVPDGQSLLRLINILNIFDIRRLVQTCEQKETV